MAVTRTDSDHHRPVTITHRQLPPLDASGTAPSLASPQPLPYLTQPPHICLTPAPCSTPSLPHPNPDPSPYLTQSPARSPSPISPQSSPPPPLLAPHLIAAICAPLACRRLTSITTG
ncbi:unnamed protein product [Cuscuta epithymum]|uniref:Uncharacterized protein n=1 Tax=Cuscuta epithymum TaxID=186058 RepID=A0AAV0CCF3_9ASTE|nr:unnamed protein product [Cuscuta epithymum]